MYLYVYVTYTGLIIKNIPNFLPEKRRMLWQLDRGLFAIYLLITPMKSLNMLHEKYWMKKAHS